MMENAFEQKEQTLDDYLRQMSELNIDDITAPLGLQKGSQGYRFIELYLKRRLPPLKVASQLLLILLNKSIIPKQR